MDKDPVATMSLVASAFFAAAVFHTFSVSWLQRLARRFPEGSALENLLHFLGEIEVVFGIWAALLVVVWMSLFGAASAVSYVESVNFTEAVFVFVIMAMAATRPVMDLAAAAVARAARLLPFGPRPSLYLACLVLGPLLGSAITEPAAMTVTALVLRRAFFGAEASTRFKYATLGLLFVNISIGGTLTHFAAPPVLMVAGAWRWDTPFMLATFGWRAALAVVIGAAATTAVFRQEIAASRDAAPDTATKLIPVWVGIVHLVFIAFTIAFSHHMAFFVPVFLFFLGFVEVTKEFQDDLKLRESLLVAFFLGGLVTLGKLQDWWLKPLLTGMQPLTLFGGALGLTAVTDNAALTYLGTLVPTLGDAEKVALVGGAVVGGGLTVIANAPNPVGFGLLRDRFGPDGISALGLLAGALPYTLLAAAIFILL